MERASIIVIDDDAQVLSGYKRVLWELCIKRRMQVNSVFCETFPNSKE